MRGPAKIFDAWTTRAARFAFIAWTLAQPAAGRSPQVKN
jgi:hypothetical protein